MKNFYFSLLPALFSILFFTNDFSSKEEAPSEKDQIVALASEEVEEIKTFNLFELNESVAHKSDELTNAVYLDLSKKPLREIYQERPKELNIILPTEEADVTLNLRRHQIVTDDFQAYVKSSDGSKRKAKINLGTFYTGSLEGEPNSVVTISVFENEVMGVLTFGNQNYNLGKMRQGVKDSDIPYVLFKERDMKNPPVHECQVPASESAAMSTKPEGVSTTAQKLGNVVKVYIECDFAMYQDNGSDEQATIDKTTAIFNEVATLYGNEQILTRISEIVVWDSTDPYPLGSTSNALSTFRSEVGGSFNGDIAHLISTAPGYGGGIAALDILCFKSRGHAFSGIRNTFGLVPSYSWTIEVFTHEMGHNLGSPHTQSCNWGAGGNEALDDCYPTEGGCAQGPTPSNGGTIMSYCHLSSVGINFANGFGVEPGNLIRDKVANANCLEEVFDCFSKIVLEPGVTFRGTTTDGAAREFEDYSCSSVPHRGPEIAHVFTANVPGRAYLTYTETEPDQLDLFMNTQCEPNSCVKMWNGAALVQDSFDVVPGTEYIFLVDVVEDSDGGEYTLRISFPNAGCNTNVTLDEGIMYTGNTAVNGTANALDYNCSTERYLGNEVGHIYTPTMDGKVFLYYNEDLPVQADLLLMEACDNMTCIKKWTGGRDIRDSIDVIAGKGYFFFVDIKEDNLGGNYNLLISAPGSGCATTVALSSGDTYNGNSSNGAANFINYNCGGGAQSGNEVGHFFIHPEEARARVQFNDPTGAGFNLYLADACNPDSCIQMWSGNVDEEIPITALRNYFFIVDKPTAGADADYDLTVTIERKENTCFCFDPTEPEICENFESYFGGDLSPQSDCWNVSTSANDGLIDVGNAISGDNALKITDGRSTFFDLGNRNSGKFILKFKQNVTNNKEAFWRVYHTFDKNDPANNQVAFDIEMTQTGGIPFAKLYAGSPFGSSATFPYLPLWQEFVVIFDLDNNTAEFTYANIKYHTWDFSNTRNGSDGNGILAGIEFYNNGAETEYLIDNVQFVDNSAKYCDRSGALYCDDFDDRRQGEQIVDPMGGFWNIMDRNGGASFGNASTLNSNSGLFSAQLRAGNPTAPWDDIVCDFGVFDQGRIKFSHTFYIPTGNTAHFRTLHTYNQNDMEDEEVGSSVYLSRQGDGVVLVGGEIFPFDYTRDSWVEYVQIVDFENDESTIFIEGISVASFPFSNTLNGTGGTKKWAGFNYSTTSDYTDGRSSPGVTAGERDRFTWMFIDNVEMFDLDLFLSVDPEELYVDETSGSTKIKVESNTTEWKASTDEFWIDTPAADSIGQGDGEFTLSWEANTTIESRGHDVLVTGQGVAPKVVRVIQLGSLPFMDVGPNGIIDVPASAGVASFDVTSNVLWNVLSSDTTWMRPQGIPGGIDDGRFEIAYDLNIGPERIDTVFVEGQPAADIFILVRQAAAGPTLVVEKDTICVDGNPGTVDFEVLANVAWDINNSNSWVGFSPDSGNDARDVTITYEENPTTSNRYATFTLTGPGVPEETVVVKQTPIPAFLEADPLNINLTKDGGSTTFDISSNVNWIAQETASWFTIDDTDRVDDSAVKTIDLVYEENTFPDERIDTVFISGDNGVADIIVIVRQEGAGRLLSVSTISITLPPTAGDTFIDISSNIGWRARTLDAWYDLNSSDTYNGNLNERVLISYQENQTTGTRTGEIELTGSGVSAITILINQEAQGAFLDITPCDVQVDENAGSFDITVEGNVGWMLAPDQGWITTSTTSGSGSTTVRVDYLSNGAPTTRTGTIVFTPTGAPGVAGKTVTINQTGAGFIFEVDQDTICVGPALTQVRTNVTAANFTWLVSDDAQWVVLNPANGGFGNGGFMVQIFANPNGDTRYAHVTVETQDGSVKLPIVVKQTGANPDLEASPTMINVGDAAGMESFNVTGNVTWTASSADSWIHTFSPESALGDSNVNFNFDANPTTDTRTGTIEVSSPGVPSSFITVMQAGGAQTLSVAPTTINVTAPAGSSGFDIVASGDWTVTSNDAWLETSTPATGSGDGNVIIDYQENTDVNSRMGTYTVELTGTSISETVTVIQEGASSILDADPMVFNLPAGPNGSETVNVTSNIDWTATENSGGWLDLQTISGSNDGSLPFNYLTNFDVNARTAEITLAGNGATDKVIVVNQAGADVIFSADNLTLSVSSPSGDVDLDIDANVDWEVCEINDPWITAITPMMGTGAATLNIAYAENTAPNGRTGTFKICNDFNSDEITVTVNQSAAGVTFGVDKTNISFGQPGGSEDVVITSNLDWTVKSVDTWISMTPAAGSGDGTVMVSGSENLDFAPRTGTVTICSQGQPDIVITVEQGGRTRMLTVDPTSITVDQPSGSSTFDITSNSDWTVKTDATWISNFNTTSGTEDGIITFDFTENSDLMQRVGIVKVCVTGLPDTEIMVTQAGRSGILSVDRQLINVDWVAGSEAVDVTSNTDWEAAPNDPWLFPNPFSGTGDATINIGYLENPDLTPRTGTVTISAAGLPDQVVTIIQGGMVPPELTANPTIINVLAAGGMPTFEITSNIDWVIDESETWLSTTPITAGSSGNGNETITVAVSQNIGGARSGVVTLTGAGVADITITINQEGVMSFMDVSTNMINLTTPVGDGDFTITSNVDWQVSDDMSWFRINTDDEAGTGNRTVRYDYDENTDLMSRTGTITVEGLNGVADQIITVTQAGLSAMLDVSTLTINLPANAGSDGTFEISSNIMWDIMPGASWLNGWNPDLTGTGNETITFAYDSNPTSSPRTTTITVSGSGLEQIITVNQEAASQFIMVDPERINLTAPAGDSRFTIESNLAWMVDVPASATWITRTSPDGTGNGEFTFNYTENTGANVRTTLLTVSAPGVPDQLVEVNQQGTVAAFLDLDQADINRNNLSGSQAYNVTSNVDWDVTVDAPWVQIIPSDPTSDNGFFIAQWSSNTSSTTRVATITVTGAGVPDVVVTITQDEFEALLEVNPNQFTVGSFQGSVQFDVTSNITWSINSNATWLRSISNTFGSNNSTIVVDYETNFNPGARTAVIEITGAGITRTVEITQDATTGAIDLEKIYGLTLYPNPVSSEFTVDFNLPFGENLTVDVLDVTGKMINRLGDDFFTSGENQLIGNVTQLSPGMYLLRFKSEQGVLTKRFVVSK